MTDNINSGANTNAPATENGEPQVSVHTLHANQQTIMAMLDELSPSNLAKYAVLAYRVALLVLVVYAIAHGAPLDKALSVFNGVPLPLHVATSTVSK